MKKVTENKNPNKKYLTETGFFKNGLPFTRVGNKKNIIVDIEALSFKHEPASGFMLRNFIKSHRLLAEEYTVFLIGRRPNLPQDYLMDKMAEDYAEVIREEFKRPVDVMGISTGGQIAQYLAADHPDTIRKLVIISAAYRLSKRGVELERQSENYFKQGKYGKSMAVMMDFSLLPGLKRSMFKFFIQLIAGKMMGDIEYPNDFLAEVRADREMNFINRLKDIKAPTLIMSGELDIGYTIDDVRATAEGIPDAQLILYKGYGHNLTFSNMEQVQKDMLKFLRK
jgi:pimeloyl-ACP methyl ester carboxylesterase